MMIVDVLLPLTDDDPKTDVDVAAERMGRELGMRFESGAMIAQLVRFKFAPPMDKWLVTARPSLRVRDGPSVLTGKVLGRLPTGAEVVGIAESGDWLQHESPLGRGWSVKEFLEKVGK